IGTLSIIIFLKLFNRLRSVAEPSMLIKYGAIATMVLNALLAAVLLAASLLNLDPYNVAIMYLALQLFIGVPFALITGAASKLAGSVIRWPRGIFPNVELRRCKVAGATGASAIGALVWCIVIVFDHAARTEPGWYAILFALNILPALFLLRSVRRLDGLL